MGGFGHQPSRSRRRTLGFEGIKVPCPADVPYGSDAISDPRMRHPGFHNTRTITRRDVGVSPPDVSVFCFRALCFGPRAYDVRAVGYIFCPAISNTERNVGVSPPDVGAICFRALWLAIARTTVGPSATFRSVDITRH